MQMPGGHGAGGVDGVNGIGHQANAAPRLDHHLMILHHLAMLGVRAIIQAAIHPVQFLPIHRNHDSPGGVVMRLGFIARVQRIEIQRKTPIRILLQRVAVEALLAIGRRRKLGRGEEMLLRRQAHQHIANPGEIVRRDTLSLNGADLLDRCGDMGRAGGFGIMDIHGRSPGLCCRSLGPAMP